MKKPVKKSEPMRNWFGKILVGILLMLLALFLSFRHFYSASALESFAVIGLYLVALVLVFAGLFEAFRKVLKKTGKLPED